MIGFLLLLGCGGGSVDTGEQADHPDDTATEVICDASWDAWGAGFFRTYCAACHAQNSPNRHDAPEGVDFDTLSEVQAQMHRVRARVLDEQSMPVGGGVPEDVLNQLETWLDCVEASP